MRPSLQFNHIPHHHMHGMKAMHLHHATRAGHNAAWEWRDGGWRLVPHKLPLRGRSRTTAARDRAPTTERSSRPGSRARNDGSHPPRPRFLTVPRRTRPGQIRSDSPRSKLVLPTVDTCPWRLARPGRPRECGLVATSIGARSEGLAAVSDDTCAACCRSSRRPDEAQPGRREPPPRAASRVLDAGGTAGCGSTPRPWPGRRGTCAGFVPPRASPPDAGTGRTSLLLAREPRGDERHPRDDSVDSEHADHDVASPSRCRMSGTRRGVDRSRGGSRWKSWSRRPIVAAGRPSVAAAVGITTAPRKRPNARGASSDGSSGRLEKLRDSSSTGRRAAAAICPAPNDLARGRRRGVRRPGTWPWPRWSSSSRMPTRSMLQPDAA